jgi:hypothetical protein
VGDVERGLVVTAGGTLLDGRGAEVTGGSEGVGVRVGEGSAGAGGCDAVGFGGALADNGGRDIGDFGGTLADGGGRHIGDFGATLADDFGGTLADNGGRDIGNLGSTLADVAFGGTLDIGDFGATLADSGGRDIGGLGVAFAGAETDVTGFGGVLAGAETEIIGFGITLAGDEVDLATVLTGTGVLVAAVAGTLVDSGMSSQPASMSSSGGLAASFAPFGPLCAPEAMLLRVPEPAAAVAASAFTSVWRYAPEIMSRDRRVGHSWRRFLENPVNALHPAPHALELGLATAGLRA